MRKILSLLLSALMVLCACSCNPGAGASEQSSSASNQETPVTEKVQLDTKSFSMFLEDTDTVQKIAAAVYEEEQLVENAEVTYEVSNPDVAQVQEDGTIIAKGVGLTEVKVKYKRASATAEVRVMGKATMEQVNTFDEKYVNLYGRTYIKNEALCLDHVASGVEVTINGTMLRAEIEANATVYLCVYVDGAEEYQRIEVTSGENTYALARGLEKGIHTIRVVKSSEVYDGKISIVSLKSESFYTAPEKSSFRIEFVGDSITAGYGALGATGAPRTVANSDACSSFAYYTAQKLGVDYSMVALQGICVKANMWINDCMSDVYKIVSPHNAISYDFAEKADVVVVNLGTNDAAYVTSKDGSYSQQFPKDYLALLRDVRRANPDAYIVCLYGFMGKHAAIDSGIAQAVQTLNDKKTVYLADGFFADALGAAGHPSKTAQKAWADTLVAYIQTNIMDKQ